MDNTEWSISKSNLICAACNGRFQSSQAYYSALLEQDAALVRHDFCLNCFQEPRPANVFYFWKTAIPEDLAAKPKPVLDVVAVLEFFRRLAGDRDPQRVAFRYVLALMLTRKKALKLGGGERGKDGEEVWIFVERRGGERHAVVQPNLDEAEMASSSLELGRLLGIDAPAPASTPVSVGVPAGQSATALAATDAR